MKSVLTSSLLLPSLLLAQELTADTIAIEPSLWQPILQALLSGLAIALTWLVKNAMPVLNQWLKAQLHFRGSGVVMDAICQALIHLSIAAQKRLQDGNWSPEDVQALKAEAKKLAEGKLRKLGGFYKADLVQWIDEQVEIGLGKLLASAFGTKKDG